MITVTRKLTYKIQQEEKEPLGLVDVGVVVIEKTRGRQGYKNYKWYEERVYITKEEIQKIYEDFGH